MMGYFQAQAIGNLVADPEERCVGLQDNNRRHLAAFRLAVNGEKNADATFVDCEAWDKLGEAVLKYSCKGSPLFIAGRLRIERWKGKDGVNRERIKLIATDVRLLSARPAAGDASYSEKPNYSNPSSGYGGGYQNGRASNGAPSTNGYGGSASSRQGYAGQRAAQTPPPPQVEDADIPF